MTTRLTPRAIKPRGEFTLGCREVELTAMQKADAVEFFHKQKIKGTHAEIEATCAPYGYHPLSLRLLAGRILKDFENPADIVVAQKLKIDGDIIQQKHHVLEVSYDSLPEHEQKLLSTIACFRSPVELKILEAIEENDKSLQDDLHDLVARGLLHFDEVNRKFDLHPIVRRYAYERLTAPDRTAAHYRLINYFEAVPQPPKVERLEDLVPVIELYHHMVKAGKLDEAFGLLLNHLANVLYFQFGTNQQLIELLSALFLDGEDKPPRLKDEGAQAWTLNAIANSYSQSGQHRRAVPLFQMQISIREKQGSKKNLATGLGNVASMAQHLIGELRSAKYNLLRAIKLDKELEDETHEAYHRQELGLILSYCGTWQEADQELDFAWKRWKEANDFGGMGQILAYKSINALLRKQSKQAFEFATQCLELAQKGHYGTQVVERDIVVAFWLVGTAYCSNNNLLQAEVKLEDALARNRAINLVEIEANILLDLARLRYDQKKYEEAKSLADEALLITERCGYVLQGADVNLFLAQYALEQEKDKAKAKEYAEEALKLATCDGPPYYYKVAYEEAERFLEQLAG